LPRAEILDPTLGRLHAAQQAVRAVGMLDRPVLVRRVLDDEGPVDEDGARE
jgi:hypothetical protein